jgi:hypothetical protein
MVFCHYFYQLKKHGMNFSKYIFSGIFLMSAMLASGQDFNGGVLGGLSTSEISGDRLQGPNKAGMYLGAYVNRYFSQRFSLQMELDYIQKGSRNNPDSASYEKYLLRLNYIEMPFHARYDFAEKATVEGGLSLGVLIRSYEEANGYEWTSGPEFKPIDFSLNIGLFYTLVERLRINVRYSNSIIAVRPHSSGETYRWNKGQYNEVLSFVLFYDL